MAIPLDALEQYQKNEPFPIHASYIHDEADLDTTKPGGYFTKDLYSRDLSPDQIDRYQRNEFSDGDSNND